VKPQSLDSSVPGDFFVSSSERLVEVVQELSLARDMPTVQEVVRTAARELTGADGATFVLRDDDKCYYADEDAIAPLWKGRRFPMETCISGWVMLNKSPVVIHDIYDDPRIPAVAYRPTFVKSLAMVPIRSSEPLGAIGNYWARPYYPSEREVNLLEALAGSTAVAMESVRIISELEQRVRDRTAELELANAEIRRLSLVDELTGLNNRRGFFAFADQSHQEAARQGKRVFFLFIDVDGLKQVNDSHGHEAGDALLRDMAAVLRATFRKSDIIARLGGDEFCVFGIMDDGDPSAPKERLAAGLSMFNANRIGMQQLAASVGGFSFAAGSGGSLAELMALADAAMYAEKRARRTG
jgi:diguanylate cyclase (GGDEF)-like protein